MTPETSAAAPGDEHAGVFATGDVRHRSVKRVASAVREGSVAIRGWSTGTWAADDRGHARLPDLGAQHTFFDMPHYRVPNGSLIGRGVRERSGDQNRGPRYARRSAGTSNDGGAVARGPPTGGSAYGMPLNSRTAPPACACRRRGAGSAHPPTCPANKPTRPVPPPARRSARTAGPQNPRRSRNRSWPNLPTLSHAGQGYPGLRSANIPSPASNLRSSSVGAFSPYRTPRGVTVKGTSTGEGPLRGAGRGLSPSPRIARCRKGWLMPRGRTGPGCCPRGRPRSPWSRCTRARRPSRTRGPSRCAPRRRRGRLGRPSGRR